MSEGGVLCSWLDLYGHKQERMFPEELLERVPPDPIEPGRSAVRMGPIQAGHRRLTSIVCPEQPGWE